MNRNYRAVVEIAKTQRDNRIFIIHGAADSFAAQWLAEVLAHAADGTVDGAAVAADGVKTVVERVSTRAEGVAGVIARAYSATLFSMRRVLLIADFDVLTPTHKGKLTAEDEAALALLLDEPPVHPVVLATSGDRLDERRRQVKAMRGVEHCVMVDMAKPARSDLEWLAGQWLADCRLSPGQVNRLLERCEGSMGRLYGESAKLAAYAGGRGAVPDAEFDLLVTDASVGDLFAVVRYAAQGDWPQAYEQWRHFGTTQSIWPLVALLSRQFRLVARIHDAAAGTADTVLAQALGVHPYACKVAREQARMTTRRDCLQRLNELAELEFNVKSGSVQERTALDFWFLERLCRRA